VPGLDSAESFYDGLAGEYHLIFPDWWSAAGHHGEILDRVLQRLGVAPPARLLDCSCGIGTQALSLAALGYRVVAADVSRAAVDRARTEAGQRQIDADFVVADMREVHRAVAGPFDAAISCDNSLPHLLTDDDLRQAFGSVRRVLRQGAVLVASIRDYDALVEQRPAGTPNQLFDQGRRIVGQAWQWDPGGETVVIRLFILRQEPGGWVCSVHTTRYRALLRRTLEDALLATGFREVVWHPPDATGYYQPIVTARAI
jgi:glycine/sarcosine N-methyltransferase